jgi:hypothetical protein
MWLLNNSEHLPFREVPERTQWCYDSKVIWTGNVMQFQKHLISLNQILHIINACDLFYVQWVKMRDDYS